VTSQTIKFSGCQRTAQLSLAPIENAAVRRSSGGDVARIGTLEPAVTSVVFDDPSVARDGSAEDPS
jgi:hypothetical protein